MDSLKQLPVNEKHVTEQDKASVDELFGPVMSSSDSQNKVVNHFQMVLVIGILFMLISLPIVDTTIQSMVNVTKGNPIMTLVVKAVLFMFIFYIIYNWKLVSVSNE